MLQDTSGAGILSTRMNERNSLKSVFRRWGILKRELVHHPRYATRQQAKQKIIEYIEIFYNRQR